MPAKASEARLRPFLVQKMVVATGAFHAGAQEHLRRVGRGLNGVVVGLVPDEADDNPLAVGLADGPAFGSPACVGSINSATITSYGLLCRKLW